MSLFGFDIGMMFANVHMWRMVLLFNAMLYILVRYVSPCCLIWFRCYCGCLCFLVCVYVCVMYFTVLVNGLLNACII